MNQETHSIRQESGNEEEINWFIDNDEITSLFQKYQYRADVISKPAPLESSVQEILSLSDVLFLAHEQHSPCKLAIFKEKLLDNMLKNQIRVLLDNDHVIPRNLIMMI